MIEFTLPLQPQTMQSESRIGVLKTKTGKQRGMMFSTTKKKSYLAEIGLLARQYAPRSPWLGPVNLKLAFILPRPQYAFAKKYDDGLIWAPVYPDITNLRKIIEDGLSTAGFWKNDSQIVKALDLKYFAEKTGFTRIEVATEEIGGSLL